MKTEILSTIIILLVIGLMLLIGIGKIVKECKKHKQANLVYALIASVCFFIAGLTGFLGLSGHTFNYFLVLQVLALIFGVLHVFLIGRLLPWAAPGVLLGRFLYTLSICLIGGALLLVSMVLIKFSSHPLILISAMVWFLVPLLFMMAFESLIRIPGKIFTNWYYPTQGSIEDPSDSDLASPAVISFKFYKKALDSELTVFRAKAPKLMQFGKLFYYFINDYNDRHEEESIEVFDAENNPYPWVFYHQPNWLGFRRYIDPQIPVDENHIKENSVIVCKRVSEN